MRFFIFSVDCNRLFFVQIKNYLIDISLDKNIVEQFCDNFIDYCKIESF